jgi:molecular chaperone DnaK
MMSRTIGIDFGTSYTRGAVMDGDRPHLISGRDGDVLVPSVVAVYRNGRLHVGARAKNEAHRDVANAVFGAKRLLGHSYRDPGAQQVLAEISCRHDEAPDGGIDLWLGDRAYTPVEIAALILAYLKKEAEIELGEPLTEVVLTCPGSFGQGQRHALVQAGERAGFEGVRLLPEDIAATVAFRGSALGHEPETILVYDMGGGKFEASVLMAGMGTVRSIALAGDSDLGGDALDRLVVNRLLAQVRDEWGAELDSNPGARYLLKDAAERARIALSSQEEVAVLIPGLLGDQPTTLEATLSRRELERLACPDLDCTLDIVHAAIQKAQLTPDDIDHVLRAGGCTRMPAVHELLAQEFGTGRISGHVDPAHCVAIGAALQAQSLDRSAEDRDQGGETMWLTAVTDMPLGFATADGRMRVVIPAGTPYPTTVPFEISTAEAGQAELLLPVYQGEDSRADQNEFVGQACLELPPDLPAGTAIEVQLSLDADGIASVACVTRDQRSEAQIAWGASPPAPMAPDASSQASLDESWRLRAEEALAMARHTLRRWQPLFPLADLAILQEALKNLDGALARDAETAATRLGEQVVTILSEITTIRLLLTAELAAWNPNTGWEDRADLDLLLKNVEMAAAQGDERAVRRYCSDLVACVRDIERNQPAGYEPSGFDCARDAWSSTMYGTGSRRRRRVWLQRYKPRQAEVPGGLVTDRVHFSVTAPPVVPLGSCFLLDVWAHLEQQRELVLQRARAMAGGSKIIIRTKGPVQVTRGTVLTVQVSVEGLSIEEPQDTILWDGQVGNATFPVLVPQDASHGTRRGQARIHVDGLRIARLHFLIEVGAAASEASELPARGERHRRAFASYASKDRDAVLARVQGMLKALPDLDLFLDVASLRSGQDWAQELMRVIPASDVFYLFWSEHAKRSEWVEREWRCALETRGLDFIDPVPLVSPELVPPPAELAAKHFNDWILAFIRQHPHS